mgnify:FL=1
MIDEDLELNLVLDSKNFSELLHQLLPVTVSTEGGPRRAECSLRQVSLRETPGLKQLKLLKMIKIGISEFVAKIISFQFLVIKAER